MFKQIALLAFMSGCSLEPSQKPEPNPPPASSEPKPKPAPWPLPNDGLPFPVPPMDGGQGGGFPYPVPLPGGDGTGAGAGGGSGEIVAKETYLRFHNLKRCWHQVGPVTWNEQLAARAQAHADKCVFAHDATANAGENLAQGFNSDLEAMDQGWYMEVTKYRGDWSPQTGHFSQMVWKGSTEIGCGAAQCPSGRLLVCRYLPQGNVMGQFSSNVFPARSDIEACNG